MTLNYYANKLLIHITFCLISDNVLIVKRSTILFLCLIGVLLFACNEQNDSELKLKLEVEKISSSQILLTWNSVSTNDEFRIWRVNNKVNGNDPELMGTVDPSTLHYIDDNLPLSHSLTYYLTTIVEGKELKSNEIQIEGAESLPILPYQMELIPNEKLAIVRGYRDIFLINFEQGTILKELSFDGRVGQMFIKQRKGILELFIPCTDNNIYILNARNLLPIDTIDVDKPIEAVVVNGLGKIFCSGFFESGHIRVYDRNTHELITAVQAESNCGLALQNDNNLVTVSKHLTPATMSYYTFNDEGFLISRTDDPYGYDYEMESDRLCVSDDYIVTSREGFIYTANQSMTYVAKINQGGSDKADFEFSSNGNTIYATVTNQNSILKSTIVNDNISTTVIKTQGYPWILARDGSRLVVLSSPEPFYLSSTTSGVIIEIITVQ
ncbi:MAG: hypothetical protein QY309_07490 [Cyclobacteriaceae bacterium]|nr:MAG: hypothetical protein QY309_07490 [Cyclobacteriaceae bacterium]